MLTTLVVLLRAVGLICRGHRAVALENLAELSPRTFCTLLREFSSPSADSPTRARRQKHASRGRRLRREREQDNQPSPFTALANRHNDRSRPNRWRENER